MDCPSFLVRNQSEGWDVGFSIGVLCHSNAILARSIQIMLFSIDVDSYFVDIPICWASFYEN